MMAWSLYRYFGGLFLRWTLGIYLGAVLLVFLIDCMELARTESDRAGSVLSLLVVSALRVPLITEQIIPFAVLIGSIAALVTLSRRSELVVSRAAGLSVWQFIAPGLVVAAGIGVFGTLVYNPLTTTLKRESDRYASAAFGRKSSVMTDVSSESWLRQRTDDGEAVLKVAGIADEGRTILQPIFWIFNKKGVLSERVEAGIGELDGDRWRLSDVTVVDTSGTPKKLKTYDIPTKLGSDQVRGRLGSPDAASFWRLPSIITKATAVGLPPYRFLLQFHVLLSRPFLLMSMVLIAATVSLGMSRAGGTGRMILGGVSAGFVLYVATEISRDLGSEGLVPPALAAWAPAVVAMLFGCTILLFREDG
jgi:lipopolysaccharide export system permease protein